MMLQPSPPLTPAGDDMLPLDAGEHIVWQGAPSPLPYLLSSLVPGCVKVLIAYALAYAATRYMVHASGTLEALFVNGLILAAFLAGILTVAVDYPLRRRSLRRATYRITTSRIICRDGTIMGGTKHFALGNVTRVLTRQTPWDVLTGGSTVCLHFTTMDATARRPHSGCIFLHVPRSHEVLQAFESARYSAKESTEDPGAV